MIRAMFFVFALLIASPSIAIEPPSLDYGKMPAGSYKLDRTHANVIFKISHLGYSDYIGRFNGIEGMLDFNSDDITKSKISVSLDPTTVDVNNKELESKLIGEKYFNAEKFPQITFTSTKITSTGPTTGIIDGDLNFLGVTKPVRLQAKFNGGGNNPFAGVPQLGFSANASLKRSEWGMTELVPAVGDKVDLIIEVEFHYQDKKTTN